MSGKGLDQRLSQAFLRLLERNAPRWTHQEEVYQCVEQEVKFTEKQLALHAQKAGQIEPNWQHDLRNLQHTLKRNGTVINPERELWALPVEQVEFTDVLRHWNECVLAATGSTGSESSLTTHSGQTIERQLFVERIHHLLQCGGLLPRGRMHNWSRIEQALVSMTRQIRYYGDWVVWQPSFDNIGGEGFNLGVRTFLNKANHAEAAGKTAVNFRTNKGRERRTMSHLPEDHPEQDDLNEELSPPAPLPESVESQQPNNEHVNSTETNSSPEGDAVDDEDPAEPEAEIDETPLEEDEGDTVRYDVCSLDPENGFHNTPYEEFTHRIDAPSGLGRRYYCPLCGCPFVATQRDRLIFFRHAGGDRLSPRETFEGWPETEHGSWNDARERLDYREIHHALGDDNLNSVREESRRTVRESLQLNMTIGYFVNDFDERNLNLFVENADGEANWGVILDSGEKEFEAYEGGQYLELPDDTQNITICPPDMPQITLTLPPARLIMDAESVNEARAFSLVDPQYRWEDATGSMLVRTEDRAQGVITIGGQAYRMATLDDRYSIRIGLPHFDGQVILPEGEERLPLVFQEGREWTATPSSRLRLQTSDLEPFFLPRGNRVVLNSERIRRGRDQHMAPRVQIRIPQASQTVALESYPLRFGDIQPSAVFLNIDGMHHPIGNAIEVNQKPNSICLVAQEKTINLEQHHAKLWYKNHLDDSGMKFQEGPLNEMLETLQTLTEQWFVLSFELNNSRQVYDRQTIMMKPIPPLKPKEARWYGIGGRQGRKWWDFFCQNSSTQMSANARLLEERTELSGCPPKLKKFILENKSEMVTWLTNHKRQRT